MKKTCKDCFWFYDQSGTGKPILDECVCWLPRGGKNYFVDLEPCDSFEEMNKNPDIVDYL